MNIGDLRAEIADLPDDMPVEVSTHEEQDESLTCYVDDGVFVVRTNW